MEFNEKLQQLRKGRGITQEELAAKLYVSRTAISKWESGRGYPNIESLKAISTFFGVTLDELLSTDEAITIAEDDSKNKRNGFLSLACGLIDICAVLLLFLPFFAQRTGESVTETSLLELCSASPWLKICYIVAVISITAFGVLTLALQSLSNKTWMSLRPALSLVLSALAVVIFVAGLQPYAAIFTFVLLAVKSFLYIKKR